jgi:hypothetical protein
MNLNEGDAHVWHVAVCSTCGLSPVLKELDGTLHLSYSAAAELEWLTSNFNLVGSDYKRGILSARRPVSPSGARCEHAIRLR